MSEQERKGKEGSTTAEGDVHIEDDGSPAMTRIELDNPRNVNTFRGDLSPEEGSASRTSTLWPGPVPAELKNPGFIRLSPEEVKKWGQWLLKNPHVGGLAFSCLCFFLACVIFVGTFARRHAEDGFWQEFEPIPENQRSCEKDNNVAFFRQPSNAVSGFSFLLVGFIVLHCAVYDFFFNRVKNFKRKNPTDPVYIYTTNRLRRFPTFSLAFAFANLFYGAGNIFVHACYCNVGLKIDVAGAYSVALFPGCFMLYEFYPVFTWFNPFEKDRQRILEAKRVPFLIFNRGFSTHLFFIWVFLAISLILFSLNEFAAPPFVAIGCIILVLDAALLLLYLLKRQRRRYLNWRYLVAAALFLMFAGIAWLLDEFHCTDDTQVMKLQAYAVYNYLTALTALFIFFYLRTEKALDEHQGLHYDPLSSEMVTMSSSTNVMDVASSREGDELEDEDDAVLDYDSDLEEDEEQPAAPAAPAAQTSTTPATTSATTETTTTTTIQETSSSSTS